VPSVELTAEETAWLRSHPVITLGSDDSWSPYIIKNEDGSISGYDRDVLELGNATTGANFQLIAGSWKQMLEKAVSREIDGLSTSAVHKSREAHFNFSDIYITTRRLLVVSTTNPENINSADDLAGKKIGYQEKNLFDKKLVARFTDSTIVPLKSLEDVLQHLITGKIDATVGSHALIYLAERQGLPYIRIADYIPDSRLDLVFSIRKDWPHAVSILNKGLKAVAKEKTDLRKKWFYTTGMDQKQQTPLPLSEGEKAWLAARSHLSVLSLENFQPFSFRKNNIPMGYSIETMKHIGRMLGKEIRFIKKPWNEQLEMLKRGELDIIPHLAVTEERKAFADYTDFIHLTFLIGFAVPKDQTVRTMADFEGRTIAVVRGYYLHRHLEKHFPDISLLPVNSTEEAVNAVARGQAFAVVDNVPTLNFFIREKWLTNLKVASVNDFGLPLETRMPMGVTKGHTLLKSILEKANAALPPDEMAALKRTWMLPEQMRTISLSPEETTYLREKQTLNLCIDPDWLPLEATVDGQYTGMSADYIRILEKAVGLPIRVYPTATWQESLDMGKTGKCDLFSMIMETPDRRAYLNFSPPYFKTPIVIATPLQHPRVSSLRDMAGRRLGIVKGYAYGELLRRKYPDIPLVNVASVEDGLKQVEQGTLSGFIGSHAAIGYHIQQTYFGQIKISGKLNKVLELSIGTRKDEPLLRDIFNKAIATLTPVDHRRILNQWVVIAAGETGDNDLTPGEKNFIKQHPVIRFRIRPDRPPFELAYNGKAAGLAVDYLSAIAEIAGFTPEFVVNDMPVRAAYDTVAGDRAEFDTLAFSVKSKERAKRFTFGDAFLSYP
ncbi:MAG: transporter substrate-binding domain-containing protein, partial [Desulfobacterales bacterium]|nr:transporter substrate-binding domain-containing protein [Desulfobacterales bacterium]